MPEPRSHAAKAPNTRSNYIVSIVFNGIFLYVVNKVPDWNIVFITGRFSEVLWALNLSIVFQLVGNGVLYVYHPLAMHHLVQTLLSGVSALAAYTIWKVYPFALVRLVPSISWLDTFFRWVLLVGVVGTAIGGVVNLVKFLRLAVAGRWDE